MNSSEAALLFAVNGNQPIAYRGQLWVNTSSVALNIWFSSFGLGAASVAAAGGLPGSAVFISQFGDAVADAAVADFSTMNAFLTTYGTAWGTTPIQTVAIGFWITSDITGKAAPAFLTPGAVAAPRNTEKLAPFLSRSPLFSKRKPYEIAYYFKDPVAEVNTAILGGDESMEAAMARDPIIGGSYTGQGGDEEIDQVYKFNGVTVMPQQVFSASGGNGGYWCGGDYNVTGLESGNRLYAKADGLALKSRVTKEPITLWVSNIYRSLELTFAEDTNVKGIDTYRYTIPDAVRLKSSFYFFFSFPIQFCRAWTTQSSSLDPSILPLLH